MSIQRRTLAIGGGAGGGVSPAQLSSGLATKADTATVTTALAGKADQAALDSVVATNATDAEVAAIQTATDAAIALKPDVALQSAVRQPDQSILLTFTDTATASITPPAAFDPTAINAALAAETAARTAADTSEATARTTADSDHVALNIHVPDPVARADGDELRVIGGAHVHVTPTLEPIIQRIRHISADFDYPAENLPERELILVQNSNAVNVTFTYGAGGTTDLRYTTLGGATALVSGQDSFTFGRSEIAFVERIGTTVCVTIVSPHPSLPRRDYAASGTLSQESQIAIVDLSAGDVTLTYEAGFVEAEIFIGTTDTRDAATIAATPFTLFLMPGRGETIDGTVTDSDTFALDGETTNGRAGDYVRTLWSAGNWDVLNTGGASFSPPPVVSPIDVGWTADKPDYTPGDRFTQDRNVDGALWLFEVPATYTGTAGSVWSVAEEARYEAVGAGALQQELNLPAAPYATVANIDFTVLASAADALARNTYLRTVVDTQNGNPLGIGGGVYRIFVKDQTDRIENGIYRWETATGDFFRFDDMSDAATIRTRSWLFVRRGDQAPFGSVYEMQNLGGQDIVVGTTPITVTPLLVPVGSVYDNGVELVNGVVQSRIAADESGGLRIDPATGELEVVPSSGDQAAAWEANYNTGGGYVQGDIRSASEPDNGDADFGRMFNWFHVAAGPRVSGAAFDVTEKAFWQRMAIDADPDAWTTVDGDTGTIWLTAYVKTRLIGAAQTLLLPTPGGMNLNHESLIRNDSPNEWTISPGSATITQAGNAAPDVGSTFALPAGQTARIISTSSTSTVYDVGEGSHTHQVLGNIAVHVRSAGTNASSSVDIELLLDGAWNPTDWVVSTTPVTGLEDYTAGPALQLDKAAITGPIGIGRNKDGWLFFEYVGDATETQLTGINYTGANNANSDGAIIVNFAGTNQHIDFADKASVVVTDLEFEQSAEASGALRRVTITSSDTAFADEAYDIDYSLYDEQLFESEIYAVGPRTLTFNAPIRDNPKKTRIHRVFINANTADVTVAFAPGSWKKLGTTEDAADIVIPNGGNRTLELTASDGSSDDFVRVLGEWGGPSLDVAALTGGFMYLPAEDPVNHIYAMNGQTLAGGVALYPEIVAKWPAWASGADLVLPDWRGRAMMATGALGITGAVGTTYADGTAVNGLRINKTYVQSDWNGQQNTDVSKGSNSNPGRANDSQGLSSSDSYTRPNAVGLVLCVIAGRLKVTTVDAPVPASFVNLGDWNGVNLQNAVTNGMLIGGGSGPAGTGAPSAAWTGSCKITAIGDWIQQDFLTANAPGTVVGERFSRQSFNGGTTWSAWFGQ